MQIRSRSAFTLIEVLIGMAILAVGLVCVASLFPVAAMQQRQVIDDTQGVIIGHNILALLRNDYPTYLANGETGPAIGTTTFAAPASTTPLNLGAIYTDPSGIYSYQFAWRQVTNNSPVEVAIFVYRNAAYNAIQYKVLPPGLATPEGININAGFVIQGTVGLIPTPVTIAAASSGTPGLMNTDAGNAAIRPAFSAGDRGQVLLYNVGPSPAVVVRAIQNNTIDTPPTTAVTSANLYFLPQKAVAIVTGTIP